MSERPYSRVYWEVRSDDRFVGIYTDNHHLSTWLRLLIGADMAWPAPADIPAGARRSSVKALCDAGLIEVLPGHLYRVHGLDRERNERSQKARESVMHRYSDRSTTVERTKYDRSTSRAKPSQAENEPSQAEARDPADDYWSMTGRYPNAKVLKWLDDLTVEYGAAAVSRHLGARYAEDQAIGTLLGRVGDSLRREARGLDRTEREAEQARVIENRRVNVPLLMAQHNGGHHEAGPNADCPYCKGVAA